MNTLQVPLPGVFRSWLDRPIYLCLGWLAALRRAVPDFGRSEKSNPGGLEIEHDPCKVLIFDGDTEELRLYAKPFEGERIEVHKCASIESALRCIEREQFDLVLVDQGSPRFESRRILRHLIRYNWPMPFIVMAQQKDAVCRQQAVELGASDYIEKPISATRMVSIIEQFLAKAVLSKS